VRIFSIAGLATPSFWLGIVFILTLLVVFKWLPPMVYTPFWVNPVQNLAQLIWPALAVGYRYSAVATRMTRSSMLEVLQQDYMRTAKAKGLAGSRVLFKHGLRNALIPIITLLGLTLPSLLAGAAITESIFSWPGLGFMAVQSVGTNDFPVVLAIVMIGGVMVILGNLLADVLYGFVDPRIKY